MKASILLTAAALTLIGSAALAAPESDTPDKSNGDKSGEAVLAPAFKNTVLSTYPDGRTAKLWLSPGGTYRAQGRKKDMSNGTWKLKGDQICMKQKNPSPPLPLSYCTAIPSGGVGSTWDAKSVFGDALKVKLVAGRG